MEKDKVAVPYPSLEDMHKEEADEAAKLILIIKDVLNMREQEAVLLID